MPGLTVTNKIRVGFLVMVMLPLALGLAAYLGVESLRTSMSRYAAWGQVDMVMNEDVIQNLLKLDKSVQKARYSPDSNNLQEVAKAHAATLAGLDEWQSLIKDQPRLIELANQVRQRLDDFNQKFGRFSQTQTARHDIRAQWDALIKSALEHLQETMEEVIDPTKEKVARDRDVENMDLWGNIDMVMNEAVIANFLRLKTTVHDYVANENPANQKAMREQLQASHEGLQEWQGVVSGQDAMERAAGEIAENLNGFQGLMDKYLNQVQLASQASQEMDQAMQASLEALEKGMEEVIDPAKDAAVASAQQTQQDTSYMILAGALLALIAGVVLAWYLSRSVNRPLTRIISGLEQSTQEVTGASGQVSLSSQSLAEGANQQAASLEETSSSMEELSSMTERNAKNAAQADTLMHKTNQVAEEVDRSMVDLKKAMEKISSASNDTVRIIRTIDEIAFQTNLLALNAAVEAARAGEAGAGFAVVADEVRNLAMRAADAARNTAELIEGSINDISQGSQLVSHTDEAFNEMADNAKQVTTLISEIASASNEQAQGIGQINQAVNELSQVTQGNAANAEQSAAASQQLDSLAGLLKGYVAELSGMVVKHAASAPEPAFKPRKPAAIARPKSGPQKALPTNPAKAIPLDEDDFQDF